MSLRSPNRRQFLGAAMVAAGSASLARPALAIDERTAPYGPFRAGLQSYSLRHFKADRAIEMTRDLGLGYWEAYPGHVPMSADEAANKRWKDREQAVEVKVAGYGVIPFTKDHDANRKAFEYAKAMKIEYLSADPEPGSFESLDKLCEEYKVGVGIHNHGPGARYSSIADIAGAIKGHHPMIGCCIDTGHFLRSGVDPVAVVEAMDSRIFGVHLKDVKDRTKFTILGEGDLRLVDFLRALAVRKYKHLVAIEYEENESMPMDDIRACLAAFRKAAGAIG